MPGRKRCISVKSNKSFEKQGRTYVCAEGLESMWGGSHDCWRRLLAQRGQRCRKLRKASWVLALEGRVCRCSGNGASWSPCWWWRGTHGHGRRRGSALLPQGRRGRLLDAEQLPVSSFLLLQACPVLGPLVQQRAQLALQLRHARLLLHRGKVQGRVWS